MIDIDHILDTITEQHSYYLGGSLCVDIEGRPLVFNLPGKAVWFDTEEKVELTEEQAAKVRQIYVTHKGKTPYYLHKCEGAPDPFRPYVMGRIGQD